MQITDMTLTELSAALARRDLTSQEITAGYLERIRQVEERVGAFLSVDEEAAMKRAKACDRERDEGKALGPLHGIPVAVKDNICVAGRRTTCASRMLADFVPPYSATAWDKLDEQGCVLLGKTNLDEFAMGSSTENSAFHPTRNPWDLTRVPGGSSGGSAAAVSAGETAFALGSDTGGSIRQPAAFCGVVGMKPTYGAVSRWGLVAFASSLDQIGPITRTVADNAMVLAAIAGQDPKDATSIGTKINVELKTDLRGLCVGLLKEAVEEDVQHEVRKAIWRAADALRDAGATVREVRLPRNQTALPAYYIISSAEASSNLARYDGIRYGTRAENAPDLEALYLRSRSEGFGSEVKRRILLGTFVLSAGYADAYYRKAQVVRQRVIRGFNQGFKACDLFLGPVAPTTAWKFGEKTSATEMYRGDIFTVPASLAGLPALSVPAGFDAEGMPIGVQLVGSAFSEMKLYRVGQVIENAVGIGRKRGGI